MRHTASKQWELVCVSFGLFFALLAGIKFSMDNIQENGMDVDIGTLLSLELAHEISQQIHTDKVTQGQSSFHMHVFIVEKTSSVS